MSRRPTSGSNRHALIGLCCACAVMLNFPMLIVFDGETTVFGLPRLPVALFTIWAGLIAMLAWVMEGPAGSLDAERPASNRDLPEASRNRAGER